MKRCHMLDLDGTLVDSMPVWKNLALQYLEEKGIEANDGLSEKVRTLSLSEAAELFQQEYEIREEVSEITEELNRMIADQYAFTIPLKEGVKETLRKWRQEGMLLCVVTSTDKRLAAAALKRLDIFDCFQFILTCDEVGEGKHSPLVFEEAAKRLNASKSEVIVFEDALFAIQTASKAGFDVVGVFDQAEEENIPVIKKWSRQFVAKLGDYES